MQNETPNLKKPSSSLPGPRRLRRRRPLQSRRAQNLQRIVTAGGIIYRVREGILEFFFMKDGYGKWTFPKGKVALGETLAETAIREIREETGLVNLRYVAPLGTTSFRFRRENVLYEKTIHHFLFEAPATAEAHLTGVEGITEMQWFPIEKAKTISSYRNLDRLFARALAMTAGTIEFEHARTMHRREVGGEAT